MELSSLDAYIQFVLHDESNIDRQIGFMLELSRHIFLTTPLCGDDISQSIREISEMVSNKCGKYIDIDNLPYLVICLQMIYFKIRQYRILSIMLDEEVKNIDYNNPWSSILYIPQLISSILLFEFGIN